MRQWRGMNFFMMGLILLIVLFSEAMAEPNPELRPPNSKQTITTVKVPEVHITVTGKLIRIMAIGGETTGWAVDLDEPRQIGGARLTRITIDPAGRPVADFDNRRVEIAGILEKRSGIERGEYWVIVVKEMRGYSN